MYGENRVYSETILKHWNLIFRNFDAFYLPLNLFSTEIRLLTNLHSITPVKLFRKLTRNHAIKDTAVYSVAAAIFIFCDKYLSLLGGTFSTIEIIGPKSTKSVSVLHHRCRVHQGFYGYPVFLFRLATGSRSYGLRAGSQSFCCVVRLYFRSWNYVVFFNGSHVRSLYRFSGN